MTWALKRQLLYIIVIVLFFSVFGSLIVYPNLKREPTCTDRRQNGTESGVDCGGSCARACLEQTEPISILWSRAFRVIPGRYNAVAYLENRNKNTAVSKINYRFRFADANNLYIGKREGSTFVPPAGRFAIFEPAIDIGNSIPVYVTFEFTETPLWTQVPKEKVEQLQVFASDINLTHPSTSPRLSAMLKNNSLFTIPEVNVVVILYDVFGNAVSASSTYLDELKPEEKTEINFTWPEPLQSAVIAKEIIPMFNIFSVKLK